jgi:hypothetical protein
MDNLLYSFLTFLRRNFYLNSSTPNLVIVDKYKRWVEFNNELEHAKMKELLIKYNELFSEETINLDTLAKVNSETKEMLKTLK